MIVEGLVRLINDAYSVGEAELWTAGTTRTTPDEVAELIRTGGMLTARAQGRLVGCACVRQVDPSTADLGFVSTDPLRWGGGVGRRLVDTAEELVRSRGASTMELKVLVPRDEVHPEKDRLRAGIPAAGTGSCAPSRSRRSLRTRRLSSPSRASSSSSASRWPSRRASLAACVARQRGDDEELHRAYNRRDFDVALEAAIRRSSGCCRSTRRRTPGRGTTTSGASSTGSTRPSTSCWAGPSGGGRRRRPRRDVRPRYHARGKGSGIELDDELYHQDTTFEGGRIVRIEYLTTGPPPSRGSAADLT